ncbi:HAMP domain-containing histidine kinase [Anaerobacillus sp. CMMVII]|uniref:sensor histidine kinase n=1 Tax=Anaerobacillus sp. CMMVII TaxID=2755588 RepID=UPI0021B6FC13|nr:HAMP domain-containing sensor histidine kinase [Anaerobacillus sp. CMMVII]MCT8139246.1 HAMP domain-containing histidine kinase [Anaerobacillus sp. CMMVII]
MSLQKRLNLSFMAMIVIPCILFTVALFFLFITFSGTDGVMNSSYQLQNIEKKNTIFSELKLLTTSTPTSFYDENYLSEKARELEELNIALLIRIDDDITFSSNLFSDLPIKNYLTPFGQFVNHVHNSVVIGSQAFKFEQHDFYLPDQREASIFFIKETSPLEQFTAEYLPILLVLLIVIIVLTNGTLSYLVSRSIVKPLKTLQQATENIKSGNLDFKIEEKRKDEIGHLTRDFESMRQKLKHSIEVQQLYEENRKLLISNISHDLKTPITSIKGYVEGLRDGVANTKEKQQKYVSTIYRKANELDALIDELFLFSTLDLNRASFHFEKLNIVHFIQECIDDLSYGLEKSGVQIKFQNPYASSVLVTADPEKLMRVFNNIIQNSIKYIDKDPGQITITLHKAEDLLFVTVEDNGSGIDSDDLPSVFESFYRADKSRNSKTGGTGLGLAISKQIIEAHGGSIWAESTKGMGTAIKFSLKLLETNGDTL